MTYEEKYSKCDTITKLEEEHLNDTYAINDFEELGVCDRAYTNRYRELMQIKPESIEIKNRMNKIETIINALNNQKRFVRAGSEEDKTLDSAIALIKINSGEWIDIWNADAPDTSNSGRCSLCNRISSRPLGKYCRWCGAYMGGEKNE